MAPIAPATPGGAVSERLDVDVCVIGAGSGGLSVAAGASQLGMSTVLIERGRMGGDCLNYGCVPSKSLLAAAKRVKAARGNGAFGLGDAPPAVDFAAVMRHVQQVIAAIAPQDSVERFTGLGVRVIAGSARFSGPREVTVGEHAIRARRIVIATGSAPALPPIPGLAEVPFLTNETVFDATHLPEHLIVIGCGPIGMEMAQAHRLLGARVSVLEAATALPKDDPELVALLVERLRADGVVIEERVRIRRVELSGSGIAAVLEDGGAERRVEGSHLLVAAGRRANLAGLDLDKAGIATNERGGLVVDRRLRTSNRRVYAVGDAAGGPQFTHVAGYHAGIVIRNALFRLPAKVNYRALPWVTYTDPELAQAGMTEAEAMRAHPGDVQVLRWPFHENDRAQAERETQGLVKVLARRNGRVLGATILGAHAGELIQSWCLALSGNLKLATLAGFIAPYPTLGEASKRAAGSFFTPKLFNDRTRRLLRLLSKLG
jgi:pyruvate/2-oxoglutarate dehydrogenase complex dihydrolipoamide dehydrogenase (E3) component